MPSRRQLLAALSAGAVTPAVAVVSARREPGPTPPDWPMARYDPAGTGYNPDASGPTDDVDVAWRRETGTVHAETVPQPIMHDGTLFAAGSGLIAVDAGDGTADFEIDGPYASSVAAVDASAYRTETLAVTAPEGAFGVGAGGGYGLLGHRFGAERWEGPADSSGSIFGPPEPTTPVAVEETAYVVVPGTNELVAIDGGSGRVGWRYEHDQPTFRPAIRDGVAYLTSWAGDTVAVDLSDGTERWRYDHPDADMRLRPTASDRGLVVPTRTDLRCLDVETRDVRWHYEVDDIVEFDVAAAVAEGTVYLTAGRDDGALYAVDLDSGAERWTQSLDSGGTPVVAAGTVYVPADARRALYAFDADDGEHRFRFDPWDELERPPVQGGLSSPVAGDGRLYVRTREELLALEGST